MDRKGMGKAAYKSIKPNELSFNDRVSSHTSRNQVFRATWETPSGKITVAAKRCNNFHEEEVLILARLKHNNIIKFLGVVKPVSILDSHIIVTEYAEQGSLYDVIGRHHEDRPEYMQSRWMKWAQDGARALQYIHQNKYQHGDVKSPNFLVMRDGTLKLCDFGISRKCELTISTVSNRGSWPWMAPEAFGSVAYDPQSTRKPCKVTTKSDVFSYGIVMWEMLSGQAPHPGKQQIQIYKEVVERGERLPIPSNCPEHQQMSELLNKCWQADYRSRPTMDEVLQTLIDIGSSITSMRENQRKRQLDFAEDDFIQPPSKKKSEALKPDELLQALMPTLEQNAESLPSQQPVDPEILQIPERSVYTCNKCKLHVEERYHCTVCEDYDLCSDCYRKIGHNHKMEKRGLELDVDSNSGASRNPQEARRLSIQRNIQSLVHACQCRDANCRLPSCQKMKRVVQHTKVCKRKTNGECPICKQVIVLCCYHAKHCQEQKCLVPFCLNIKHKLKQQQLQHRLQQAQLATMQRVTAPNQAMNPQASTTGANPIQHGARPQQATGVAAQQQGDDTGAFKSPLTNVGAQQQTDAMPKSEPSSNSGLTAGHNIDTTMPSTSTSCITHETIDEQQGETSSGGVKQGPEGAEGQVTKEDVGDESQLQDF